MNRLIIASVATLCASLYSVSSLAQAPGAANSTPAKNPNAVIATVNGTPIKQSAANLMFQEQANKGVQDSPEVEKAIRGELIMRELFAQEAHSKGLDKRDDVQTRLDMARQGVLVGAYLDDYLKAHPVTEADIKAEYERQKKLAGAQEYKLRHIVVKTEAEADDIIKQLKGGAKFEDLAKKSEDASSRDNGGELGWTRPNAFVEPMRSAILALKKGQYTAKPLKSNVGYHVVKVDDLRKLDFPAQKVLEARIKQALTQDMVRKHGEELESKASIK